jgi:RNA polymerase sigma factor (TIGR02999 family)
VHAPPDQLAKLLARTQEGDAAANDELLALLYEDLRRMAHWHMARERQAGAGHTLQATALVHEAYMRLFAGRPIAINDRRHFFAAAGLAMRRILVERARRVAGPEAGGNLVRVELDADMAPGRAGEEPDWEALDRATSALAAEDPELAEIVHLRYYAGLSVNEVAEATGSSPRTIDRRWQVARAWILDFLAREGGDPRSKE